MKVDFGFQQGDLRPETIYYLFWFKEVILSVWVATDTIEILCHCVVTFADFEMVVAVDCWVIEKGGFVEIDGVLDLTLRFMVGCEH